MAVKDFFLDGSIASNATLTIQPASGTIYSFKRGNMFTSSNNITIRHRGAGIYYGYVTIANVTGAKTMTEHSSFITLVFSEAGVTGYNTGPFPLIANATPFAAISNSNYVDIVNAPFAVAYYTLVGVSIT